MELQKPSNACFPLHLPALQLYQEGQVPAPDPTVTLCFGEELHDLGSAKNKLIIVQVSPFGHTSDLRCQNQKLKDPASPLRQINMLNCQHLLESVNLRRSQPYCNNPTLDVSDSAAAEQVAHIYQDLCSYSVPQRSACYRENMPITA